jgi:hypothetical protein
MPTWLNESENDMKSSCGVTLRTLLTVFRVSASYPLLLMLDSRPGGDRPKI